MQIFGIDRTSWHTSVFPSAYLATNSLELVNTSTAFLPNFWTIIIPVSKASYLASLFVAEKPNLKDFSIVILFGDIRTNPTPDSL